MKFERLIAYLTYIVFPIYSIVIFFSYWNKYAYSQHDLGQFDGALQVLPHFYIRLGLIPYKDFGVVYPPGLFLLIGKLIPFASISERNFLVYLFIFLTIVLISFLLFLISSQKKSIIPISFFILFTTPLLTNENLSDLLIGALILLISIYLMKEKNKKVILSMVFLISLIIIFFRWDRMFLFLLIQLVLMTVTVIFNLLKHKSFFNCLEKVAIVFIVQVMGFLVGVLMLFLYFKSFNIVNVAFDFIYTIPLHVILNYRKVPLPPLELFHPNSIFYITTLVLFISALFILFVNENKSNDIVDLWKKLFLISFPLIAIPYALGRADPGHSYPFLFYTALSLILILILIKNSIYINLILLIIALTPLQQMYRLSYPFFTNEQVDMEKELTYQLHDCNAKIININDYKSIFVGKILYEKYIYNTVALYFVNTDIKPATAYISDEPGLQNGCYYGDIIVNQLKKAEKPMLVFIENQLQWTELNKTESMKSCRKIENFLAESPHKQINQCIAYGKPFLIRLYY